MAFPPIPTGRRLGPWVADDDWYSGDPVFGNAAGIQPTAQQVFDTLFVNGPYATMLWTGGLYSSGPLSKPAAQEAQDFSAFLSLCDRYPNIKITAMFFINLTGNSIPGGHYPPPAPYSNVGFNVARASPLTQFTIASTAGLSPSTNYTLQLTDPNFSVIAAITTITTDSTGAFTGTAALPQTTDDQANQGGYVLVQGTHVATGIGWQNDQQADFLTYMTTISGHSCFIGAFFEQEYYGNSPGINTIFQNIVNGAGYYVLGGINNPATGNLAMNFSAYPFLSGVLPTGIAPLGEIGYQIGFDGAPDCVSSPCPSWTSTAITNVIQNAIIAPCNIIIIREDVSNPLTVAPAFSDSNGDHYLYLSPTAQSLIASNPYYQTNYLRAGVQSDQTPTTTTVTVTSA